MPDDWVIVITVVIIRQVIIIREVMSCVRP